MWMIIMHHILVHGLDLMGVLRGATPLTPFLVSQIWLNSILVMAVNAFVLISGYYGISTRARGFCTLFLQGAVFTCILFAGFRLAGVGGGAILPTKYWFLVSFLGLYLIAQYINLAMDSLKDREVLVLVGLVAFLQFVVGYFTEHLALGGGYSVVQLICIYVYGRAIRRHSFWFAKIRKRFFGFALLLTWLTIFSLTLFLRFTDHARWACRMFNYDSPLVVLGAAFLLILTIRSNWRWNGIRKVSIHVFGVYLLHDNEFIQRHIVAKYASGFLTSWIDILTIVPILAIVVFTLGCLVNYPIHAIIQWILDLRVIRIAMERVDHLLLIQKPSKQGD